MSSIELELDSMTDKTDAPEREWTRADTGVFMSACVVFIVRYNSATFTGGFAYLLAPSATMVGYISSAYTFGAAIASLVTPALVAKWGTKRSVSVPSTRKGTSPCAALQVFAGMAFSVLFKLLFAFTPVLLHSPDQAQYL